MNKLLLIILLFMTVPTTNIIIKKFSITNNNLKVFRYKGKGNWIQTINIMIITIVTRLQEGHELR